MSTYAKSTHAELYGRAKAEAGCLRISAKLQEMVLAKEFVSAAQRKLMRGAMTPGADRQLADLLDALARQVHHGVHIEGDAEQLLAAKDRPSLLQVFGPKLAEQQRNARHHVILEAANIVLRTHAAEWLHGGEAGKTPHERALASNSGLAAVLVELEALRK